MGLGFCPKAECSLVNIMPRITVYINIQQSLPIAFFLYYIPRHRKSEFTFVRVNRSVTSNYLTSNWYLLLQTQILPLSPILSSLGLPISSRTDPWLRFPFVFVDRLIVCFILFIFFFSFFGQVRWIELIHRYPLLSALYTIRELS